MMIEMGKVSVETKGTRGQFPESALGSCTTGAKQPNEGPCGP
jgi:hypothetical protein